MQALPPPDPPPVIVVTGQALPDPADDLDRAALVGFRRGWNERRELPSLASVWLAPKREERAMANSKSGPSKRGFAAMSPEKQREIAAKGGRASHGGGRKPASASAGARAAR